MTHILSTTRTLTLGMDGHETEVSVEVTYTYTPACRGSREQGSGIPLEPDYSASVDLLSVLLPVTESKLLGNVRKGVNIGSLLSGEQVAAIEAEILEEYHYHG